MASTKYLKLRKRFEAHCTDLEVPIDEKSPSMMFALTENLKANQRMQLMGALGGCDLRIDSAGTTTDAAYWSTWAIKSRMTSRPAAAPGLDRVQRTDALAGRTAQLRLLETGMYIHSDGRIEFTAEKSAEYAVSS